MPVVRDIKWSRPFIRQKHVVETGFGIDAVSVPEQPPARLPAKAAALSKKMPQLIVYRFFANGGVFSVRVLPGPVLGTRVLLTVVLRVRLTVSLTVVLIKAFIGLLTVALTVLLTILFVTSLFAVFMFIVIVSVNLFLSVHLLHLVIILFVRLFIQGSVRSVTPLILELVASLTAIAILLMAFFDCGGVGGCVSKVLLGLGIGLGKF